LVIIPEEAEILLPIVRITADSPTYLLTYAAPVTRRMLHFGDLKFYSVPTLPQDWLAPMWLKLELGIYAGRLYFGFTEYHSTLDFLGIRHTEGNLEISEDTDDEDLGSSMGSTNVEKSKVFARRPLTFLQEWLAVRRKGQNFDQTPMGFICQGKVLLQSHHFFSEMESTTTVKKEGVDSSLATPGGLQEVEEAEEEFEDEDQGEIFRPEDLKEDFDVRNLNTAGQVLDYDKDEDD
jgi:hypothetical protein